MFQPQRKQSSGIEKTQQHKVTNIITYLKHSETFWNRRVSTVKWVITHARGPVAHRDTSGSLHRCLPARCWWFRSFRPLQLLTSMNHFWFEWDALPMCLCARKRRGLHIQMICLRKPSLKWHRNLQQVTAESPMIVLAELGIHQPSPTWQNVILVSSPCYITCTSHHRCRTWPCKVAIMDPDCLMLCMLLPHSRSCGIGDSFLNSWLLSDYHKLSQRIRK
jgi:hypothetical protein